MIPLETWSTTICTRRAIACRTFAAGLPLLDRSSSRVRIPDWWYERFTEDWKDADPDIPELIEARERLAELRTAENTSR